MSTDAAEVSSLLPPDHRVGEVEVVDVAVVEDLDSQGDDAVRVVLTLAEPQGDTWSTGDVQSLRSRIRQGLVRAGEQRSIVFSIRSSRSAGSAQDDDPPTGPNLRPGSVG